MNHVALLCRLTTDPELRYSQGGTQICRLSLAHNVYRKGNESSPLFMDAVCFGSLAETITKHFRKGQRILVEGSLDPQSWTDQSGQKRSKIQLIVNRFHFVDAKNETEQS